MRFYPKELKIFVLDSCIADMPEYSKTLQVVGIPGVPPTMIPVVKASPIVEKILDETLKILSQS